jgi:hypothetical protein
MVLRPSDLAEHARQDEQEMTVLCLRILQAALVYVNTLTARLGIRTTAPRTPCANSDSAP